MKESGSSAALTAIRQGQPKRDAKGVPPVSQGALCLLLNSSLEIERAGLTLSGKYGWRFPAGEGRAGAIIRA